MGICDCPAVVFWRHCVVLWGLLSNHAVLTSLGCRAKTVLLQALFSCMGWWPHALSTCSCARTAGGNPRQLTAFVLPAAGDALGPQVSLSFLTVHTLKKKRKKNSLLAPLPCPSPPYHLPLKNNNNTYWGWKHSSALRALVALPRDLGSVPRTHVVAHNHL